MALHLMGKTKNKAKTSKVELTIVVIQMQGVKLLKC